MSLDAFRGLTIAAMILVNNPGSWASVYPPLLHAPWHGWTPTDLIFPFFLFIVGVAIPLAFASRRRRGQDRATLLAHAWWRGALLALVGLAMAAYPFVQWEGLRYPGVLQRIGLVYALTATAYLFLDRRALAALTVALLLGYWALMSWVPVPGFGAGDLSPDGNLAAWLDRTLMDGHLWSQSRTWDPEGLLGSLPAVATCLLGVFTGMGLRAASDRSRTTRTMLVAGIALIAAGWLWGFAFPINKNLWTSSYVLFTAGWALAVLAVCSWAIDLRGHAGWARPFVAYGRNALAVFVASGLLAKTLFLTPVARTDGSSTSLYGWIYETVFLPLASPVNASLAFALSFVVLWWAVAWGLDRKRVYVKI